MASLTDEQLLERNFVKWCKEEDIMTVKGPASIARGIPDRIVMLPHFGGTIYVEFKGSSYYGLAPMQTYWKDLLEESDPNRYYVVDNEECLEQLKHRCKELMGIGKAIVEYEDKLLKKL
jgi:hypothetical protein